MDPLRTDLGSDPGCYRNGSFRRLSFEGAGLPTRSPEAPSAPGPAEFAATEAASHSFFFSSGRGKSRLKGMSEIGRGTVSAGGLLPAGGGDPPVSAGEAE